jgi:hypothetical protein
VSRIRSIHPGLWTDVEFVGLSAFARLLFIGIWNECDDKGIFLWSPLHLKMRILPADNLDASQLLAEIEAAGNVRRYDVGGKTYGAVKNFAKFQRPKKPNDIHPAPAVILAFAGHGGELAPAEHDEVREEFPTGGEKSQQMEEGGGNGSSEPIGSGVPPTAIDVRKVIFDTGLSILTAAGRTDRDARSILGRFRKDFGDPAVLVCLSRCQTEEPHEPVEWLTKALQAERNKANGQPNGRPRDSGPDPIVDALARATREAAELERSSADTAGGFGTGYALPAQ